VNPLVVRVETDVERTHRNDELILVRLYLNSGAMIEIDDEKIQHLHSAIHEQKYDSVILYFEHVRNYINFVA